MRAISSRIPVSGDLLAQAHGGAPFHAMLVRGVGRALDTVFAWRRRWADRLALQALDDRMLSDIGISRADVEIEARKPFWRA